MGKLPSYKEDLRDVNIGNVDVKTIAAGTTVIGAIRALGNTTKTGSGTDYYLLVDADGKLSIRPLTNADVVTVEQATAANLKATVTQASTARTISAALPAGTNNIGDVDIASAIPAGTNIIGAVKRDVVNYTKVHKYVALSTTGETTVWDPTSGKKFVITDIAVSATAAGTCTLRDGSGGSTLWIASLATNGGFVLDLQTPIESSTADNILTAQASAITQYVLVTGYEV